MPKTPWGIADNVTPIAPGLAWVDTPSHGGLRASVKFAMGNLSLAALAVAERRFGSYFFEEDCLYAVAGWELRDLRTAIGI